MDEGHAGDMRPLVTQSDHRRRMRVLSQGRGRFTLQGPESQEVAMSAPSPSTGTGRYSVFAIAREAMRLHTGWKTRMDQPDAEEEISGHHCLLAGMVWRPPIIWV